MKEESPQCLEYYSAFLFHKIQNVRDLFEEPNPFHIGAPFSSDHQRILTPQGGLRYLTIQHYYVILSQVNKDDIQATSSSFPGQSSMADFLS